jgi:ribonucleoside-diphosphate reductase alpha chain
MKHTLPEIRKGSSSTDIITSTSDDVARVATSFSKNAMTVLEHRYLKRDERGVVAEKPEDLFDRVAQVIAGAEDLLGNTGIAEKVACLFYNMMVSGEFLPNSPTLMNAGRELGQLSACFVLPVDDSMDSIFQSLRDAALIHKSGGGTGFSFSRLRPKNDMVKSTRGISSGPVSFMSVFDAATETIKQGGTRRGANMGILRVDHTDIREFIACKRDGTAFTNFNISVAVTDEFMDAVKSGGLYNLVNPHNGQVTRRENAREVFELIVENAHATGDPGVIFIDRINAANPLPHMGDFESTNPCVTGTTWIATSSGPRLVKDIVGTQCVILVDGIPHDTDPGGFFVTGTKSVMKLTTDEGYALTLTHDHPVRLVCEQTRYGRVTDWIPAGGLHPGDRIMLNDHRPHSTWPGALNEEEGYLLGLLVGDGVLKKETAVLSVWPERECDTVGSLAVRHEVDPVMETALFGAMQLRHRSDFQGWMAVRGRGEYRLKSAGLRNLALGVGMSPGNKVITPELEMASSEAYRGFLCGLFDCDGSVQGDQAKGISIRLAQSDLATLQAVQRMLLRLGIVSTVYENRREEGYRLLPDGNGGQKEYAIKAQHELVISNDNLLVFAERIGFTHEKKAQRLAFLLQSYRRKLNRERFTVTVASIKEQGTEMVYDVSVPGINAFDANGFYVHNCGEQPLLPYESCNLGSINLAKMITTSEGNPSVDWAKLGRTVHLAVRFLDNVIEVNRYPLPKIADMTRKTRKIGLGVMGFADMLITMGIPYDSAESEALAEEVMSFIDVESKAESSHLAVLRGAFPAFAGSRYEKEGLPPLRNATTTTVAPTGTISIIAGCSSGIEPLFAVAFTRRVLDGKALTELHPRFRELMERAQRDNTAVFDAVAGSPSIQHIAGIPEEIQRVFRTASDIPVEWHIRLQAAFQRYTDNAVSKTINFPHDATIGEVAAAYQLAYEHHLKGVTIYRDGSRESQVLTTARTTDKAITAASRKPRPRPPVTHGTTEKIKTGCGNLYVTINSDSEGLCEVFCQMGRSGGCTSSQSEAISRLISLALRSGVSLEEIVSELKGIRCPSPIWQNGRMILSCADAVASALNGHIENGGFRNGASAVATAPDADSEKLASIVTADHSVIGEMAGTCPDCGGVLISAEGCLTCRICGFSKCG